MSDRPSSLYRLLITVSIACVVVTVLLPVATVSILHILPYMHVQPFTGRLQTAIVFAAIASAVLACLALRTLRFLARPHMRAWLLAASCLLPFAAYLGATLQSNLLGMLVWVTPGFTEVKILKVMEAKRGALGLRSQRLVVRDESTHAIHHVEAARRWFPQGPFNPGDVLEVEAKSGSFGTIISRARIATAEAVPNRRSETGRKP